MDTLQSEQNPVISYDQSAQPSQPLTPAGRSLRVPKKPLFIGVLLLLILLGGVLVFKGILSRSKAQFHDVLLATVGDQKIYKSDVAIAAREQYNANLLTDAVLRKFYDLVIERAILDEEANRLHIVVTDADVMNTVSGSNSATMPKAMFETAKYSLIKQQIMQKQTKNVTAYTIGVWIASYSDPQVPIYATQRADTLKALDEIEKDFQNNIEPTAIAKLIYDKYTSIRPRLAVNGYIFEKTKNQEALMNPKAYTLNPDQINNPAADKYLFAELQKIKPGQIVKINRPDGTGGIVVKAVSVTTNGYQTYDDFLKAKKKALVKTYATI